MTHFVALILGAVLMLAPGETPAQPAFRIVVVEGEDAVNIIQQKSAVAPIVEIRDRNNLPVAGATVTFSVAGQGASFGGLSTLTVTTNAAGRAAAAGFTPTAAGAIQINASAVVQGQVLSATITQTNVLTAAQAVGAAGASGGTGGGTSAAGGAAAGGGGVSGTTIGIVGAAAAAVGGGALLATQGKEESGKRELAGNVEFDVTLVFTSCTRIERFSGLVAIEFDSLDKDPLSGTATIQDGRSSVISATGCITGPQLGQSFPWGMNPTPASGPASNITFANTQTVPPSGPNSNGAVNMIEFQGAKNGDSIIGTLRYNVRIDNAQFGITVGTASVNVTLVPH
ncbi:MAG TPA: hypothetical protein VNT81_17510 [Vicinamibacterales bacterium]|nr:hypothetical protein [Vicinamibacterales bacterium]